MDRSIRILQTAVFVFIALTGTLLHFLFDLTGGTPLVGTISAVNESVWEHMKLLYFPILAAALIQRPLIGSCRCFWRIKLTGILTGLFLIPALYYTYTGALGVHLTWVDISIFYVAAAVSVLVESVLFLHASSRVCRLETAAAVLVFAFAFAFLFLTFFPPRLPIFQDPVTQQYGIL